MFTLYCPPCAKVVDVSFCDKVLPSDVTAGPQPPNPSELLGSENMAVLLDKPKEHYDLIIIDTPPINVVYEVLRRCRDELPDLG